MLFAFKIVSANLSGNICAMLIHKKPSLKAYGEKKMFSSKHNLWAFRFYLTCAFYLPVCTVVRVGQHQNPPLAYTRLQRS